MTDPMFDTPESLPGYNMNPGVLGAYAAPVAGGPVTDTLEQQANVASGTASIGHAVDFRGAMSSDSLSAELPATQTSQFEQSMTGLAGGLQSSTENLSGLSANLGASVPNVGGQPDTTPAPNPASYQMDPTSAGYAGPSLPGLVPNYAGTAIPDPAAPAYNAGGAPVPMPGGTSGPAGAAIPAGQLPGAGPMDSSGAPAGPGQLPGGPVSMPGYLAYNVPWADDSLASAVSAAAASAGPQAAAVAGSVSFSGGTVSVGGSATVGRGGASASIMALGSESGGAHFPGSSPGWFDNVVQGWIAANPPPPPPPPAPGAPPGSVPLAGGMTDQSGAPPPIAGQAPAMTGMPPPDMIPGAGGQMDQTAPMYAGPMVGGLPDQGTTNQTVGGALMGKVDGMINSFDKAPGDTTGPTPGVWDNMGPGVSTHEDVLRGQAQALAQGGQGFWNRGAEGDIFAGYKEETSGDITYDNPQDAAFVAETMRSMGADPTGKFQTADEANAADDTDPVTHEPNYDPSDIWNSPLGGISSVGTDAAEGNAGTPTSSWLNKRMTL
jgi:hypothetical protein